MVAISLLLAHAVEIRVIVRWFYKRYSLHLSRCRSTSCCESHCKSKGEWPNFDPVAPKTLNGFRWNLLCRMYVHAWWYDNVDGWANTWLGICFGFSVYFWATICKTVRPMLSDRCLSVQPCL